MLEVVLRLPLKPCWLSPNKLISSACSIRGFFMVFSITLMKSSVRLTGRYESALLGFLSGFISGMTIEVKFIIGILLSSIIFVNSICKYPTIVFMVFFRIKGQTPLGPGDSEFILATVSLISVIVNLTISNLFSGGGRSSSEYKYSMLMSFSSSDVPNTLWY